MGCKPPTLTRRTFCAFVTSFCATPAANAFELTKEQRSRWTFQSDTPPDRPEPEMRLHRADPKPTPEPAAPAVSDSQRVVRQGTRYLDVISRYDGRRHTVAYFANGRYLDDEIAGVNQALCDWRNGQTYDIKRGLLDFQWRLRRALGTEEPFFVVSGYRTPATNALLRRSSNGGVAKNSLHLYGMAADLRLQSRSVAQIARAAARCRADGVGGVGKYPGSNFVHVDCGPARSWGA